MTEYFVLHSGTGTDGGFGDYAPPYWSKKPVAADGRTIWFQTEAEAKDAVEKLNKASRERFYSVGEHDTYDGNFPVEYEYRRIVVPESGPSSVSEGVDAITYADYDSWTDHCYEFEDDDDEEDSTFTSD